MKSFYLSIYILLIILFSACKIENNIFSVVYLTGETDVEPSMPCELLAENPKIKEHNGKSLQISSVDYSILNNFIIRNRNHQTENDCDARILLIQNDSLKLCISEFNTICNNHSMPSIDDYKAIYLLKSRSGYYNYFPKDKLLSDTLIKMFGIPDNYKLKFNPPNIKREEFVKVVLRK